MSYWSVRGEQSTSSEVTALTNLAALATSSAGEFIRKTGATTFENASTVETITLANLSDVTITSVASGEVLRYNGSAWVNAATTLITALGTVATGVWNATAISLAKGGTGAALVDPNADRILFWDDSAGTMEWLTAGTGLTITTTTITAAGTPGGSDREVQFNNAGAFGAVSTLTYTSGGEFKNIGPLVGSSIKMLEEGGGGGAHTARWQVDEVLSGDRKITLAVNDADRTFTIAGDSSISGTNTGDQTSVSGNAGTVTVADAAADTTTWVLLATDQTGSLSPRTDAGITYNANTNALSTTTFVGALTGNADTVTGYTPASGSLTLAGADALTLTTAASTNVTLPTTGTLATLAGAESFTNKTLGAGATVMVGYLDLDSPASDHTAVGPCTNAFQSGYSASAFDLVYMGSGGKWLEVDADAVATCKGMMGIALEAKNDTEAMLVALPGSFVRDDTWAWTVGATLYAGETLGAMQETIPTGADAIIKVVAFAVSADVIFFNASPDQQSTVA